MGDRKNITGWQIRRFRIERKMTVDALSSSLPKASPLTPEELREIELGTRKIYDDQILIISQALGVSVSDLFPTRHKKVKKNSFRQLTNLHFHVNTPP
jgi:transcriptional regulator with XRE-family HTH domain